MSLRRVLLVSSAIAATAAVPAAAEMFGLALQARIDPAQRHPLLTAQRLWVQYRDANCTFYGAQEGTIRQVQAAECMRSMTEDRARELEKAMKFE
jgi:uncharacterized protein YecT (DUF1311 family)